jgi:hypothetical protein
MLKRVLYPNDNGGISILIPSENCGLTILQMAQKDVPAGVPYKIVDMSEIPTDRTFRDAWEYDFSNPDGYGIGHDAWFAQQEKTDD